MFGFHEAMIAQHDVGSHNQIPVVEVPRQTSLPAIVDCLSSAQRWPLVNQVGSGVLASETAFAHFTQLLGDFVRQLRRAALETVGLRSVLVLDQVLGGLSGWASQVGVVMLSHHDVWGWIGLRYK